MGDLGVVRGQIKDMRANEYQDSLASLLGLHEQKTGVFIQTSLEIGAILAQASPEILSDLREYGASIGLLFQIQDDILDYESTPDAVGKTVRKDLDQNKGIIHRIGIERARIIRQETLTKALYQAQKLQSDRLLAIAYFIAQRTH